MKRFVFIFLVGFCICFTFADVQAKNIGYEPDTSRVQGNMRANDADSDSSHTSKKSLTEIIVLPVPIYTINRNMEIEKNQWEDVPQKEKKGINWWALTSFVCSLILLATTLLFYKANEDLKKKYKGKKKELENLSKEYFELKATEKKQNQRPILAKLDIPVSSQERDQETAIEDSTEKPTTVTLSPEISDKKTEKTFYVGKPDRENVFTSLATAPDEFTTIFKLTVNAENEDLAEFEVELDLDSQLGKEVINNPDDFLYRVCEALNVNTDFNSTITTVRKGKAIKENGDWKMKEKAVIQFA